MKHLKITEAKLLKNIRAAIEHIGENKETENKIIKEIMNYKQNYSSKNKMEKIHFKLKNITYSCMYVFFNKGSFVNIAFNTLYDVNYCFYCRELKLWSIEQDKVINKKGD